MWTTAGEAFAHLIEFKVNDQFVVPDSGSLTVTIRNNSGVPFADWNEAVQLDPTITQFTLEVPVLINEIDPLSSFETRYVALKYKVLGKHYTHSFSYRLTPFLPIQATPEAVLSRLGVTSKELDLSHVDLIEAYYRLLPGYLAYLPEALIATTRANLAANNALELQAAIDHLPSLPAKMLKSESKENADYKRMSVDFERLGAMLQTQLALELLSMVTDLNGTLSDETYSLLLLTSPTDVITGA